MIKKNDITEIKITALSSDGNGIGRDSSGIAVFVPYSAPGDVLSVRIVKLAKNYAFGIIDTIISPSPFRQAPDCGVFGKCGGCDFRHLDYAEELRQKALFVKDAFVRLGKFDISDVKIHGSEQTLGYRNKAQVPFENGVCGYFAPRSHRVVPCADCKLQTAEQNFIIAETARLCGKFGDTVRNIYIRQGQKTREIMLCIVAKSDIRKFNLDDLLLFVKSQEHIKSLILNINPDDTNVILGKKNITLWGSGFISDEIGGVKVKLFPNTFYQINTPQAEKLYSIAEGFAALTENETALDLYCGIGALTIMLSRKAKKLYGAEIVPDAVKCAKENAAKNGAGNIDFFLGDAGKTAELLADEKIDVIVTDPPRKGCDEFTLGRILKIYPKRIAMISCNPATAARDCKTLCEGGYRLTAIEAVDMFPRTANVECAVLLIRE
ncbi:MAG: 23S rRNA (uracil(1939)-C(5))-methyltransferase RlmD [Ruminococcus sp.]|jgi:23S rRNA (uracil1939-C5)-methyltransferase|nr:23S rRNA (uracil(1939)-C(5))-methyltransferase RlmD [Ruminococcus sp.]